MPRNAIISNTPLPYETPSSPPISFIKLYLAGEYKQLKMPMSKTVNIAIRTH